MRVDESQLFRTGRLSVKARAIEEPIQHTDQLSLAGNSRLVVTATIIDCTSDLLRQSKADSKSNTQDGKDDGSDDQGLVRLLQSSPASATGALKLRGLPLLLHVIPTRPRGINLAARGGEETSLRYRDLRLLFRQALCFEIRVVHVAVVDGIRVGRFDCLLVGGSARRGEGVR